jgi:MOSC domain-containing protein YiiM
MEQSKLYDLQSARRERCLVSHPNDGPFMSASVVSVNVGGARTVQYGGNTIATGIFKAPVNGRVAVQGVNLQGDDQADRSVHGGEVRAVYAYAKEDYAWWALELGRTMPPGQFGENITTAGIDVNAALIGERWRVGSAILQITIPRVPCYKLAMKMEDPGFVRRFARALRPGPYFTILEKGYVRRGDSIEVVSRPSHDLTIAKMAQIYLFERSRLSELLVPELPSSWRDWIAAQQ